MLYYPNLRISPAYRLRRLNDYSFEIGPIRPPSEGRDHSLLIRATRNCPWNRCHFCITYKGQRFEYRNVVEIKHDIDVAKGIADEIKAASWQLGYGGKVKNEVVNAIVQGNPEVYGTDVPQGYVRFQCLVNVANWLATGARTAFLQDANTLIMRTPELIEVITYLKETLPSIERITSYARSKTCAKKSLDEIQGLHNAGLSRLHVGLESGCDEVLEFVQKGVTAEEHVKGGRKVVESGISLSEYVMPGLGGRRWSEQHARETARVLNQINPNYIRLRSLVVIPLTPLYDKLVSGDFEPLTEDEVIDEIGLFIENLDCNSYLVSDHMLNLLFEIEGKLPEDKQKLVKVIDEYKAMLPLERLKLRLKRRLRSYLAVCGELGDGLRKKVEQALESIENQAADAEAKTDEAILALKGFFL